MMTSPAPEASQAQEHTNTLPDLIQEQPKNRRVVGERAWGPYKVHEGSTISEKFSGGPYGLGDPDDHTLRKVEKEIMIPQLIKKKSKTVYCKDIYEQFFACAESKGFVKMPFMCRPEAKDLRDCLAKIQKDPVVIEECTKEYLDQRSNYRRTGIRQRLKRM